VDHRKVFFLKAAPPDLLGKIGCAFRIPSQHHQAGNNPVKPMNCTDI